MATSALLSSPAAPDLAMVDELFQSFRAATSRGEGISLSLLSKEEKFQLNFQPTVPSSNHASTF